VLQNCSSVPVRASLALSETLVCNFVWQWCGVQGNHIGALQYIV
jgi:hypothetical protein